MKNEKVKTLKVIREQVNRDQAERLNALGWYVVLTTKQKRPGGHSFGTHVIAKNVDVTNSIVRSTTSQITRSKSKTSKSKQCTPWAEINGVDLQCKARWL